MKTYKLICKTFGWNFSFNAKSLEEANSKKAGWCNYHSFSKEDYIIEETTDQSRIHNEYVD